MFRLTNVIPERIIFVSRGITVRTLSVCCVAEVTAFASGLQLICNFVRVSLLLLLLVLLLFLTTIELSLGGSSPYTSTDKTNRDKYT